MESDWIGAGYDSRNNRGRVKFSAKRFNVKESKLRQQKIERRNKQREEFKSDKDRRNAERIYKELQLLHQNKLQRKRKEAEKQMQRIDKLAENSNIYAKTLLGIKNTAKFTKASAKNVFIETLKREMTQVNIAETSVKV
jgi:hypothetical protein